MVFRTCRPCPLPAGRLVSTETLRALTSTEDRPSELTASPSLCKWGNRSQEGERLAQVIQPVWVVLDIDLLSVGDLELYLHCFTAEAVLLLSRPVQGLPAALRAERRLGKDRWKGSQPQPHTLATSSEILPDCVCRGTRGPGEWIESHGRQLSSPGLG